MLALCDAKDKDPRKVVRAKRKVVSVQNQRFQMEQNQEVENIGRLLAETYYTHSTRSPSYSTRSPSYSTRSPSTKAPTSDPPTVSPTDEPTMHPTQSPTDQPTKRECSFGKEDKCDKKGCVWKKVSSDSGICHTCSIIRKKDGCARNGCTFNSNPRKDEPKCQACYDLPKKSSCINDGCVWAGKNEDGDCRSCKQIRGKKNCHLSGCAYKDSKKKDGPGTCFTCDTMVSKDQCKQQQQMSNGNKTQKKCLRK